MDRNLLNKLRRMAGVPQDFSAPDKIDESSYHSSSVNPDSLPHPRLTIPNEPELEAQYGQYTRSEEEETSNENITEKREKAKELAIQGVENTLHYLRQMARDTDDPDLRHYYNFRLYEDWERHILRNLRADRFDLVRKAYNSFHYPKEKNIWMKANKQHPEIVDALEMLFQEKAIFEAEQPRKEVDSKTRNIVAAALKIVVKDLLDEAKEAADNDMKKLFKSDAEQYNNIMKSVQAGMHRAARRMYDLMDTGARDHWVDAPIDKESKRVVADYFGVNLLHEGIFNRNRSGMTINDVMQLINKMGPDDAAEHVRERFSQEQRREIHRIVERKTIQMIGKKQDKTKEFNHLMNFLAVLIGAPSRRLIDKARQAANMKIPSSGYPSVRQETRVNEKEEFKTKGKFKKGQIVKYKGENVVVVVPDAKADFVGVVPVGQEENMEDVDLVRAHLLTPVEKVDEGNNIEHALRDIKGGTTNRFRKSTNVTPTELMTNDQLKKLINQYADEPTKKDRVAAARAELKKRNVKLDEEWNKSKTVKTGHIVKHNDGKKYHVVATSKHDDELSLIPFGMSAEENPTRVFSADTKEVKVLKESMHYHTNDGYPETHGSATNPINVDKGRIPTVFDYNTHVDDMQKPEDYEMANDTTQVRVPSNVLNDLRDVIEDLKKEAEKSKPRDFDRAHYYEDTAEAFQIVHDHLAMKTVEGLKRAQYLSMRMMNVQRALMPNHVWNFIMNGGEKRGLKDYMNSVNRRYPVSAKNFDTVPREELNKNTHTE